MIVTVDKAVPAFDSYAAERTRGLYNVGIADGAHFTLKADLPIEDENWQIGVVVGPSGSGKSSVLRELLKDEWQEWDAFWPEDVPVIDHLTKVADSYAKATASLAAVGLGSVPSWLRPRQVLSTGEGFRADMAKLLVSGWEGSGCVIDEFTSVLDRQVAKVGAGAFAKAWRRQPGRRVILFTCHYDILPSIEPDWVVDTASGIHQFASDRGVIEPVAWEQVGTGRRSYRGEYVGTVRIGGEGPQSVQQKKRERMNELKMGKKCADCGIAYPPHVMDWDHRDGDDKIASVSYLVSHASWERIEEEVAKCDLVCANCHRERSHARGYASEAGPNGAIKRGDRNQGTGRKPPRARTS